MSCTRGIAAVVVLIGVVVATVWWRRDSEPPAGRAPVLAASRATAPAGPSREPGGELPAPRVRIDDDPPGTLVLEGQVIDGDGHGVAGARVVLAANPPRTVASEADGGFAFHNLIARPYTLVARAARG